MRVKYEAKKSQRAKRSERGSVRAGGKKRDLARSALGSATITSPRGALPEKLGEGVRPTSQNAVYDQNLQFLLPYL